MNSPLHRLKPARRCGYILMEVMLATGIFAMAGVSLAVVLHTAISAGQRVRRENHIVWELESRLNQARLNRLAPATQTSTPDADGVVYEMEVSLLNLKDQNNASMQGLYDIKVTARWKDENRDADMVAETYVYQP